MRTPRSYLFVPGQKPGLFDKASASGADTIILDLEDAVGPDQKGTARDAVTEWFNAGGTGLVRINGEGSPWFDDDLAALADTPCTTVMVPKATPATLAKVADALPGRALVALIETAEGLARARDLPGTTGLSRIAFGNLDFGADLRSPNTGSALMTARFELVLASRLANLPQPVDGVTTDLKDSAVLLADAQAAQELGFSGKLCIHPAQVATVNDLFSPSDTDIAWAHRVIDALNAANGSVVQIDGKMIDAPLRQRAEQILMDVQSGVG